MNAADRPSSQAFGRSRLSKANLGRALSYRNDYPSVFTFRASGYWCSQPFVAPAVASGDRGSVYVHSSATRIEPSHLLRNSE